MYSYICVYTIIFIIFTLYSSSLFVLHTHLNICFFLMLRNKICNYFFTISLCPYFFVVFIVFITITYCFMLLLLLFFFLLILSLSLSLSAVYFFFLPAFFECFMLRIQFKFKYSLLNVYLNESSLVLCTSNANSLDSFFSLIRGISWGLHNYFSDVHHFFLNVKLMDFVSLFRSAGLVVLAVTVRI